MGHKKNPWLRGWNRTACKRCGNHYITWCQAPWSDEVVLAQVRNRVLAAMEKHGPVVAWIVDDTGFPKKGTHSVGVARQYCGQVGKQDNCGVAVSLSERRGVPVCDRLAPVSAKEWAEATERPDKTEVPIEAGFQTKPEIALDQIRAAVAAQVDLGIVLADAAYGINTEFREGHPTRTAVCRGCTKYISTLPSGTKLKAVSPVEL